MERGDGRDGMKWRGKVGVLWEGVRPQVGYFILLIVLYRLFMVFLYTLGL